MNNRFVFISYAQADGREFAEQLYQSLREHGIPVWRDQRNLNPYLDFSAMIENAIKQASHILVLLSPSIIDDEDSFVRREILYAQGHQKPIIPILMPSFPTGKVPTLVNHLTWINFHDHEHGLKILLERLQQPYETTYPIDDPFREHVEELNSFLIEELRRTVYQLRVLSLKVIDTTEAVGKIRPVAYQSRRPGWFEDASTKREFDSFIAAFEFHERQVLLLGEPGAGKTTTLLAFARDKANERLMNPSAYLPVYAPIHTWDGNSSLVEWLASVTNLNSTDLQMGIETERLLLLLDGLDELPSEATGEKRTDINPRDLRVEFMQLLRDVQSTPTVVTCRLRGYNEIVRKSASKIPLKGAVTLKPLSDVQIGAYLESLPALWEALQADPTLFDMTRTPLILALLTVAYQDAGAQALEKLGNRSNLLRDQIFKTYVSQRYEFEQTYQMLPYSIGQIYDVLGQVALTSLLWGNENDFGVSVFHHVLEEKAEIFVELAQRLHLLRQVRDGVYRFIHSLLRDHFAFPYCLACLQDKNDAVRHGAALALAKIADGRAVEPLILALRDESSGMRKLAALALGEIADRRAVSALIITMRDQDKWVRSESARALGKITDSAAVDPLIAALRDEDRYVRQNAAEALGHLGDRRAVEPLIMVLGDTNDWVRSHAIDALSHLDTMAIDGLIRALRNTNAEIRRGAAVTLGKIGDTSALPALANALDDEERSVQTAAAWAMRQLGDESGADLLDGSYGNVVVEQLNNLLGKKEP